MRWILMALLMAFAVTSGASEMWRWVDENGVVHFSDRPQPGAERIDMRPAQTFTAPPVEPRAPRQSAPEGQADAGTRYTQLSILSPAEGETLWNIGAELNVQLAVEPPLAEAHELRVYLDGARVEDSPQGTQFTLRDVFRGERRLRVSIVDDSERELVSTPTIVFYVQQASLQNPAQQGAPTRPPPRPRPQPRPSGGG
jgi:hypothetical protein